MNKSVKIGANKTGLGMAPLMSKELFDGEDDQFKTFAQAEEDPRPDQTYIDVRQEYIRESADLGTVPPPTTAKGAATKRIIPITAKITGYQKLTFRHPEVLIDKLGERLAFERTGARLYEAFIQKCETVLPPDSITFLHQIHREEVAHFKMLKMCIESLGADPTAVTPCANATAVAAKGWVSVITDPRTSIAQCANVLLIAELSDNDGWDLLIALTEEAGLKDVCQKFRVAKENEERHLVEIRSWLKELVLANDVTEYH